MSENNERWYFSKEELENTPSRKCGIDADKELSQRQQAANFIQDMGQRLQVTQLCINTAIVYMHRFYCFHSFTHFHRNAIASAALFLAAKVEEQPRKLEHIIRVAQMCLQKGQGAAAVAAATDRRSELYAEQAQELVSNENVLLMTLGFDVAIEHPHAFIVKFCHIINASKEISQTSYFMASNSLHLTTMCLQYKPTVVACFCIHLVCKWSNWQIPHSSQNLPWYTYIDPGVTLEMLEQLTNEFLVIFDKCPSRLKKKIQNSQLNTQNSSMSSYPFDADNRGIPQMPTQQLPNNESSSSSASSQSQSRNNHETTQNAPLTTSSRDQSHPADVKKSNNVSASHQTQSSSSFHSSSKQSASHSATSGVPAASSLPNGNGSDFHHSNSVTKLPNSAATNATSRSSISSHPSSNSLTSSSSSHPFNSFDPSRHSSSSHKNVVPNRPSMHNTKTRPTSLPGHTALTKDSNSVHRSEVRIKTEIKQEPGSNSQHQPSLSHHVAQQQHQHHHPHYHHSSQPHQNHVQQPQQLPNSTSQSSTLSSSSAPSQNHHSKSGGHRKDNGLHHHHHRHSLLLPPPSHSEANGRDFTTSSSSSHSDIISNVVKEVAKQHEKQTVKVEPLPDDEKVAPAASQPAESTAVSRLSTTVAQASSSAQQQPQQPPPSQSAPLLQTPQPQLQLAAQPEAPKGHSIFSPPPVSCNAGNGGGPGDVSKEKHRHHHKEKKRHKEKKKHKEEKHHKHRHKDGGNAGKDVLKEPGPIKITIPKEKLVDIPVKLKIKINKDQIVTPAGTSEEGSSEPSADIKLKISRDKLKSSRKRNRDSDHDESTKKFILDNSSSLNGYRDYKTG